MKAVLYLNNDEYAIWNKICFKLSLTSVAHLRINFLAASLQIAGTVNTHLMSPSLMTDKFCFSKLSLKWSINALIESVKMAFAG